MWGLAGHRGFDITAQESMQDTGLAYAGDFLSFGVSRCGASITLQFSHYPQIFGSCWYTYADGTQGIVFSSSAGWAPICADFCCKLVRPTQSSNCTPGTQNGSRETYADVLHQPHKISPVKVFFLTWFGLMVPLVFLEALSAALMTVPDYAAAFTAGDAGGVLSEVFAPWGGGGKVSPSTGWSSHWFSLIGRWQFILVILSFSIICNCTPNTYSAALSAQTLFPWFEKIPRALWCVVMFVIYSERPLRHQAICPYAETVSLQPSLLLLDENISARSCQTSSLYLDVSGFLDLLLCERGKGPQLARGPFADVSLAGSSADFLIRLDRILHRRRCRRTLHLPFMDHRRRLRSRHLRRYSRTARRYRWYHSLCRRGGDGSRGHGAGLVYWTAGCDVW